VLVTPRGDPLVSSTTFGGPSGAWSIDHRGRVADRQIRVPSRISGGGGTVTRMPGCW